MDLAQEKRRLQEMDDYGVKTTRQWNEWYRERDRQQPRLAVARRILGNVGLVLLGLLAWSPLLIPLIQYARTFIN